MDVQRPDNARAKKTQRAVYAAVAIFLTGGVTIGVSRLRPAAPVVDRAMIWTDEVKRGSMLREVHGLGNLVPEDIRWIPAQTDSRVERILLRPGATVNPDSVILELSNPTLERDALDAEYQLKAAQADYQNLKTQLESEFLNQKAVAASVRGEFEQARIQHHVDEKLRADGLGAEVTERLSKVRAEQLAIRLQLEEDRVKNAADSAGTRLLAQQSRVEQQRALYALRRAELDALHVRAGIHGVLQWVPVEEGQRVTPGTNLARVANPRKLKAEIKIAETQAKDMAIGQKASIDTRNGIVSGQVSRIDPSVQNGTVTVDVAITGSLPEGARPDLSVDGTIEIENLKDVLYVGRPVNGQSGNTIGLFKVVSDGSEAVRVNVQLGKSSVSAIEILQGLQAGDKVILSDMSAWSAYDHVRLR
jgi:HlyD family secretion protein